MKHILVALFVAIAGLFVWTYVQHPTEWQEWKLQTQRNIAGLTGQDVSVIEESLFFLKRDSLLEQYDQVEQEYIAAKEYIENEFEETKVSLELDGEEEVTIERAIEQFRVKIAEKKLLFEEKKTEIEGEIAEVRQKYEETKNALQDLNESVKKIREGAQEGRAAAEALRNIVVE